MFTFPNKFKESIEDFTSFAESLRKGVENLASLNEITGLADDFESCGECHNCRKCCTEMLCIRMANASSSAQAASEKICPVPMLMVYAMAQRHTMLDLQPNRP
jgi:poly(3-hydroxyalkanoate) synthetase